MEPILLFILGAAAGAVIAALFMSQKSKGAIAVLELELQNAQVKNAELGALAEKSKADLENEKVNAIEFKISEASLKWEVERLEADLAQAMEDLEQRIAELQQARNELSVVLAHNSALVERQELQRQEMEKLNARFGIEFENIANRILEEKTQKFTSSNKASIELLLKPLGDNLDRFKAKVEEVYDKESKERFSLGEKVKELAELNQVISEEARNLTRALKGEAKTQGIWGEMILESILEKSGLVKDREYFMEHQLRNDEGRSVLSDLGGKKMRPDAVIKYPDNRSVIIDAKVSLTAFTRYLDTADPAEQKAQLAAHVRSLKAHISDLSAKGYDDYDKALDFVMMFIPSEPAYIAAMQGDPGLWSFAYEKRILLLNPTNLITSLKLITDLWKREHQNRNALEIASRGAKLYDKLVGFVENLQNAGDSLAKAQLRFDDAFRQLSTGNDNLVLQATKLKQLGLSPKKEFTQSIIDRSAQPGMD